MPSVGILERGNEVKVEYELNDILDSIRKDVATGFAGLNARLDAKADRSDVESLRGELRTHSQTTEGRLAMLEEDMHDRKVADQAKEEVQTRFFTAKEKRWAVVASVAIILATALAPLLTGILTGR